jgi:hypothetical protein
MLSKLRASTEMLVSRAEDDLWRHHQHPLLNRFGRNVRESGLLVEAVTTWHRIYRTSERVLGGDHPSTLLDRHEYVL